MRLIAGRLLQLSCLACQFWAIRLITETQLTVTETVDHWKGVVSLTTTKPLTLPEEAKDSESVTETDRPGG